MTFKFMLASVVLLLLTNLGKAQETELSKLIPRDAWVRTGIATLGMEQQKALALEISALISRVLEAQRNGMAVIAPSVSTAMKAREMLTRAEVVEVSLRYANRVIVVVRSALFNPLMPGYESVCKLQQDAENQLNISGPSFHVYVYSIRVHLRPFESLRAPMLDYEPQE